LQVRGKTSESAGKDQSKRARRKMMNDTDKNI